MDKDTLLAGMDFTRSRLLGTLDAIEKTAKEKGHDATRVLAWRPGPGRAHIGWQAMHCAATHHKYVHVNLLATAPADPALLTNFGGGSTPSDQNVPSLSAIREKLAGTYAALREQIARLDAAGLSRMIPGPGSTQRSIAEVLTLLNWHEAHHQGQIHLTWNLYKAANAIA